MSKLDRLEQEFWLGNRKAARLWNELASEMRSEGWTWQRFLWLLRLNRYYIVMHMLGKLSWAEFKQRIFERGRILEHYC